MRIIGVIDVLRGRAVHARGGRRDLYGSVQESAGWLIDGRPAGLARHYIETFGLSDIYLADLDAISSQTLQADVIREISALGADLWVDAGITHSSDTYPVIEAGARTLVAGLETLPSFDALADICAHSARPVAFSLDLRGGTPMSRAVPADHPEAIARKAVDAGARTIIVLDVARVGAGGGPDFDLLRRIRSATADAELLVGGGVRGLDDLRQAARIGCAGALVATAFHEGRLTAADVDAARRFQDESASGESRDRPRPGRSSPRPPSRSR